MTARQMWEEFIAGTGIDAAYYDAWKFGDDADTLARLVLEGVKTATSSAFPLYEVEGDELSEVGEYSVILDSNWEAVCIIRTEQVTIVPFQDVSADHAFQEGEGDRSLAYWRTIHERFFTQELAEEGLTFRSDMPVVCEKFKKVWPL